MKYIVLYENNLNDLIESVNWHLDRGWELAGGICSDEKYYLQAMITTLYVIMEDDEYAIS